MKQEVVVGVIVCVGLGVLAGCSGIKGKDLTYDLSQSPSIALQTAGVASAVPQSSGVLPVGVSVSSPNAPSIGEGVEWQSGPYTDMFRKAFSTPTVDEIVFNTLSGLTASEGITATRQDAGTLTDGMMVDVRRFEMNFDDGSGHASKRTAYLDCLVRFTQSGTTVYERTVTKQRSADFGTGGGSAMGGLFGLAGGLAGGGVDAAKEKEEVPKLFGDLLADMVTELRGDTRAMEAIRTVAK